MLKEGDIIQALKRAMPADQVVRFTPGPASPRGICDVLITWDGIDWFCEIKVNETKLTRLQARFLSKRANAMLMQVDTRRKRIVCETRGDMVEARWIMVAAAEQLYQPSVGGYTVDVIKALRF